ncbi:MAG: AraC family transcriptional regulator [Faecalibacterium sp.]|jgi:AraC-like DNA-binding protein|nr:AraC family transcriptional regulator [Faecalibacterium sp.]
MIENLNGIHETVNYKQNTRLRLYVNNECEHYPTHWHAPIEILCPLEDSYDAICNHQTFHLRTGDILFICPGTIHDLPAHKNGVRIIFQADCSLLNSIKEVETIITLIAPAHLVTPERFPDAYPELHRLILAMKEEYLRNDTLSESAIYARLIEMFVVIGRNHAWEHGRQFAKPSKRQEYNEKLLAACDYISEHCAEELTLEQVASEAGFSKYHFDRLFKQFTDVSFYKYLSQKRIARAEHYLIDPDISITEAAYRSGFSSISSFIRMFKTTKQCTPSEFRRLNDTCETDLSAPDEKDKQSG